MCHRAQAVADQSTSDMAGRPGVRCPHCAQVDAALAMAMETGWAALKAEQVAYLDDFWRDADIELDGDAELQQAVRFSLFHVLQAGARGSPSRHPGQGPDRPRLTAHAFWDTESFILPMLTYTAPRRPVRNLRWRHATMDKAKPRAAELVSAAPCSRGVPSTATSVRATGPPAAAACASISPTPPPAICAPPTTRVRNRVRRRTSRGNGTIVRRTQPSRHQRQFRIDGVTGPDEYTAIINNNVFTNLAARQNLRDAAEIVHRPTSPASSVSPMPKWHALGSCADAMTIPYDDALGVHQQCESFLPPRRLGLRGVGGTNTRCC